MIADNFSGLLKNKAYIGGKWIESREAKTFDVSDPATGELITKVT